MFLSAQGKITRSLLQNTLPVCQNADVELLCFFNYKKEKKKMENEEIIITAPAQTDAAPAQESAQDVPEQKAKGKARGAAGRHITVLKQKEVRRRIRTYENIYGAYTGRAGMGSIAESSLAKHDREKFLSSLPAADRRRFEKVGRFPSGDFGLQIVDTATVCGQCLIDGWMTAFTKYPGTGKRLKGDLDCSSPEFVLEVGSSGLAYSDESLVESRSENLAIQAEDVVNTADRKAFSYWKKSKDALEKKIYTRADYEAWLAALNAVKRPAPGASEEKKRQAAAKAASVLSETVRLKTVARSSEFLAKWVGLWETSGKTAFSRRIGEFSADIERRGYAEIVAARALSAEEQQISFFEDGDPELFRFSAATQPGSGAANVLCADKWFQNENEVFEVLIVLYTLTGSDFYTDPCTGERTLVSNRQMMDVQVNVFADAMENSEIAECLSDEIRKLTAARSEVSAALGRMKKDIPGKDLRGQFSLVLSGDVPAISSEGAETIVSGSAERAEAERTCSEMSARISALRRAKALLVPDCNFINTNFGLGYRVTDRQSREMSAIKKQIRATGTVEVPEADVRSIAEKAAAMCG